MKKLIITFATILTLMSCSKSNADTYYQVEYISYDCGTSKYQTSPLTCLKTLIVKTRPHFLDGGITKIILDNGLKVYVTSEYITIHEIYIKEK